MLTAIPQRTRKNLDRYLGCFLGFYLLFVGLGAHGALAEKEHHHNGSAESECFCAFHSPTLIAPAPHFEFSDIFIDKVTEILSVPSADANSSPDFHRACSRAPPLSA